MVCETVSPPKTPSADTDATGLQQVPSQALHVLVDQAPVFRGDLTVIGALIFGACWWQLLPDARGASRRRGVIFYVDER